MQEKTFKIALAHNALNIATMEAQIGHMIDKANWFKQEGEMAFHYDVCDKITKLREKKNKAIAHQTWMKRELASIRQRAGSILSLSISGIDMRTKAGDMMTSFELESMAYVAYAARTMPRRIARQAAFAAKNAALPLAA